jgi:hypothetical protein
MVQQLLDRWWSPEQICHELRSRGTNKWWKSVRARSNFHRE